MSISGGQKEIPRWWWKIGFQSHDPELAAYPYDIHSCGKQQTTNFKVIYKFIRNKVKRNVSASIREGIPFSVLSDRRPQCLSSAKWVPQSVWYSLASPVALHVSQLMFLPFLHSSLTNRLLFISDVHTIWFLEGSCKESHLLLVTLTLEQL